MMLRSAAAARKGYQVRSSHYGSGGYRGAMDRAENELTKFYQTFAVKFWHRESNLYLLYRFRLQNVHF